MDDPIIRETVDAFLKKTYDLVDDPSTDKIISWAPGGKRFVVWKPLKCSRDLLPQRLGITNLLTLQSYGFSKIVSGEQLEFFCKDFEKGRPELLEKISDRYMAQLIAFHEKWYKPFHDRLKNAKTKEEWDLVMKEQKEFFENENKERRASRLRPKSSPPPAPENQLNSSPPPAPEKSSPNARSDFFQETENSLKEMDLSPRTNRIYAFLSKAYEIVDDPSTDNIISWGPNGTSFVVWKPLKCQRDLLTRHLGVTGFVRFEVYGFSKTVSGQQLEFERADFVKGHPELLEKIGDRYVAKLRAFHAKWYKPSEDRLKNAKKEWDQAVKEQRRASRLKRESSPPPALENQVQQPNGT
ncbi:unnamed protein product [Eruca vesicaria subsp. sativa]|uniref:HSF-type DNA-binding domain-containing protein n=1 Tax=Eruca vesicaria subsp. sativa TaxID=29727 RepID=A0ABC8JM35_ERUVS|nr:unnamed protein product [Eruca vesicaria subsp. sativa]